MSSSINRALMTAVLTALTAVAAPAIAASDATGIWIDHTGRGAVEITDCGGKLCGKIIWLQDAANNEACGLQVIGNVKPVSGGTWDAGWIYDPDVNGRFDVEITLLGAGKLKVLGYLGTKMLSETMIWTRAPADLQRCKA